LFPILREALEPRKTANRAGFGAIHAGAAD
jgi:hypothetical protein